MSFLTDVLVYVIPIEVEESLTISVLGPLVSTEIFRDVSTSLDMTNGQYSKSLSPHMRGAKDSANNSGPLSTEKEMY
ncbi:MAG: hypothetical protein QOE81_495 [Verrucomicrobiota bacterium]